MCEKMFNYAKLCFHIILSRLIKRCNLALPQGLVKMQRLKKWARSSASKSRLAAFYRKSEEESYCVLFSRPDEPALLLSYSMLLGQVVCSKQAEEQHATQHRHRRRRLRS